MQEIKSLICTKCEGKIVNYNGRYICSECGKVYAYTNTLEKNEDKQSALRKKKERVIINTIITTCILIICALVAWRLNTPLNNKSNKEVGQNNYNNGATMSQQNNKLETASKSIDRFANINVDENGERYFDIDYEDFIDNYNYYVEAEHYTNSSKYTIPSFYSSTIEGFYTNDNGTKITRNFFPSVISEQRVYVDEFSNHISSVIWKIDNDVYNNMSTSEKDVIREQTKFISMALLPELDESLYENKIWSVLKESIIDNEEKAIAVVGNVCFYTYSSDDNKRYIYIYPKKDLTYQPTETKLPLEKAIIGKWQNPDGSIWEYKTNGTFTIDFSTYRPEDTSKEADILRGQDIIVIPYRVNGDKIIFKMGNVQYDNHVRIENGFKYEIESVGKTQATMKKVE